MTYHCAFINAGLSTGKDEEEKRDIPRVLEYRHEKGKNVLLQTLYLNGSIACSPKQ